LAVGVIPRTASTLRIGYAREFFAPAQQRSGTQSNRSWAAIGWSPSRRPRPWRPRHVGGLVAFGRAACFARGEGPPSMLSVEGAAVC